MLDLAFKRQTEKVAQQTWPSPPQPPFRTDGRRGSHPVIVPPLPLLGKGAGREGRILLCCFHFLRNRTTNRALITSIASSVLSIRDVVCSVEFGAGSEGNVIVGVGSGVGVTVGEGIVVGWGVKVGAGVTTTVGTARLLVHTACCVSSSSFARNTTSS